MISILVKLNPNYRRVSFTSELGKNYEKYFIFRIPNPQPEHILLAPMAFKCIALPPTGMEKAGKIHIIYNPSSILSKTQKPENKHTIKFSFLLG